MLSIFRYRNDAQIGIFALVNTWTSEILTAPEQKETRGQGRAGDSPLSILEYNCCMPYESLIGQGFDQYLHLARLIQVLLLSRPTV